MPTSIFRLDTCTTTCSIVTPRYQSFGDLHSFQETGIWRRPGKPALKSRHQRGTRVVGTVWLPSSCLAVPAAPGGGPRAAPRGVPPALRWHPPQVHWAYSLAAALNRRTTRPEKRGGNNKRVPTSRAPARPQLTSEGGLRLSSGVRSAPACHGGERDFRRGEAEGRFKGGGGGHLEENVHPPTATGTRIRALPPRGKTDCHHVEEKGEGAESGRGDPRQPQTRTRPRARAVFSRRSVALTSQTGQGDG